MQFVKVTEEYRIMQGFLVRFDMLAVEIVPAIVPETPDIADITIGFP